MGGHAFQRRRVHVRYMIYKDKAITYKELIKKNKTTKKKMAAGETAGADDIGSHRADAERVAGFQGAHSLGGEQWAATVLSSYGSRSLQPSARLRGILLAGRLQEGGCTAEGPAAAASSPLVPSVLHEGPATLKLADRSP